MSKSLPTPITNLAEALSALPGIGPKMASRLAVYMASRGEQNAKNLSNSINKVLSEIQICVQCGNLSEQEKCNICLDMSRRQDILLVVESVLDLVQIEMTGDFNGLYLVLGGLISPLNGVTPQNLNIGKLNVLFEAYPEIEEIIIGLSSTVEGEATVLYLVDQVKKLKENVKITRLARGVPTGAEIEFIDSETLKGALSSRTQI